jgi:hypothetical protein
VLMQLMSAVLFGWLLHKFSLPVTKRGRISLLFKRTSIFLIGFVIGVLAKQGGARNALVPCGVERTFIQQNDEVYTTVGGPLGSPDFETIANGVFMAISLIMLVRLLEDHRIPPRSQTIIRSSVIALVSSAGYALVFCIFHVLVNAGVVELEGHWISPCLFKYQFPHPERIGLVFIVVFSKALLLNLLFWVNSRPIIAEGVPRMDR